MRAFGAVVLRDGIDPVALLEMLLGHPRHVVLYDLGRVLHALALDGRRLHSKREPHCSRQRGCREKARIHHWTPCRCAPQIEADEPRFDRTCRNVTLGRKKFSVALPSVAALHLVCALLRRSTALLRVPLESEFDALVT